MPRGNASYSGGGYKAGFHSGQHTGRMVVAAKGDSARQSDPTKGGNARLR